VSINQRVKVIRNTLGLTQARFAEKIFMSTSHLAGIEGANKELNDRNIYLICSRFNVNEQWLRAGNGEMFSPADDKFSKIFGQLNEDFQSYALMQLDALVKLQNLK